MSRLLAFFRLARPHQHIKNVFIILPLFFAGGIKDPQLLIPCLVAFVTFSLTASGIYVLNDLLDAQEDRLHPEKQTRPIASRLIKESEAKLMSFVLIFLGLTLGCVQPGFSLLLLYVFLNVLYSFKLKEIALLDVTVIAVGFVIRLLVGSMVTEVYLSHWIVVMTFLLALFLALAKRRDDLMIHARTGHTVRIAAKGYNLEMLNSAITLLGASVIMVYLQYTTDPEVISRLHTEHLYVTTIFVILGILRYLQITFVAEKSGSPTQVLLRDRFTQINLLIWLFTYGWILYLS